MTSARTEPEEMEKLLEILDVSWRITLQSTNPVIIDRAKVKLADNYGRLREYIRTLEKEHREMQKSLEWYVGQNCEGNAHVAEDVLESLEIR